ncbi:type II CRISPR-associated endonuclease Cas1 [Halalkalibacter okhensis]|nr:type II CRISPR-associated endonuclease Cas1 [Halalkalibacter okhensis]
MITKPGKLSIRHNQLVVKQEVEVTIPLQDISTMTIESQAIVLTQNVLSACAEYRIAVIICNDKQLPNGIFTSYHQHSRQLTVLETQLNLSKPLKKRIWQKIVKQKIENQARCLEFLKVEGEAKLRGLARQVDSGDTTNREGYAAKLYFPLIFGSDFTRRSNHPINRILNYGYAIMRGNVVRALVSYGFTPCLGIHHDSQTNSFNLADDFMEVLRPLVDLHAANLDPEVWNVNTRASLVNLANMELKMDQATYSASAAVDEMIKSFVAVCRQNDLSYLKLPQILPLTLHEAV